MGRFFHYLLRTLDVAEARDFYAGVLGRDCVSIEPLPEMARARGARPHWLGVIEVEDVGGALETFQARGAAPLGPRLMGVNIEAAVLRDPGGAVVGLGKTRTSAPASAEPEVVAHVLNTNDVERAKRTYSELFGWQLGEARDLGPLGLVHEFAFGPGEAADGAMLDIAGRPAVHPHWLFHFKVPSLDRALTIVEQRGGVCLPPQTLPNRARTAVCDDSQGAAFALYEVAGSR